MKILEEWEFNYLILTLNHQLELFKDCIDSNEITIDYSMKEDFINGYNNALIIRNKLLSTKDDLVL